MGPESVCSEARVSWLEPHMSSLDPPAQRFTDELVVFRDYLVVVVLILPATVIVASPWILFFAGRCHCGGLARLSHERIETRMQFLVAFRLLEFEVDAVPKPAESPFALIDLSSQFFGHRHLFGRAFDDDDPSRNNLLNALDLTNYTYRVSPHPGARSAAKYLNNTGPSERMRENRNVFWKTWHCLRLGWLPERGHTETGKWLRLTTGVQIQRDLLSVQPPN